MDENPTDKTVELCTKDNLFLLDKYTTPECIFCEKNDGTQSHKYHFRILVHNKLNILQENQLDELSLISDEINKNAVGYFSID
jgi:hypothetical protein